MFSKSMWMWMEKDARHQLKYTRYNLSFYTHHRNQKRFQFVQLSCNCITFDFCKIHWIFVRFHVLFYPVEREKKRRRSTFWKTSEMEWNGMECGACSLMANACGCTIHYVPTDKHISSLTHFKKPKNIYLFSLLVLTLRKLRYRNCEREREKKMKETNIMF